MSASSPTSSNGSPSCTPVRSSRRARAAVLPIDRDDPCRATRRDTLPADGRRRRHAARNRSAGDTPGIRAAGARRTARRRARCLRARAHHACARGGRWQCHRSRATARDRPAQSVPADAPARDRIGHRARVRGRGRPHGVCVPARAWAQDTTAHPPAAADTAADTGAARPRADSRAAISRTPSRRPSDDWWQRWLLGQRPPNYVGFGVSSAHTYNRVEGFPIYLGPTARRVFPWGAISGDATASCGSPTSCAGTRTTSAMRRTRRSADRPGGRAVADAGRPAVRRHRSRGVVGPRPTPRSDSPRSSCTGTIATTSRATV